MEAVEDSCQGQNQDDLKTNNNAPCETFEWIIANPTSDEPHGATKTTVAIHEGGCAIRIGSVRDSV